MDYKKALLGAASALALSAGLSQPADASLRVDTPPKAASAAAVAATSFNDPLLAVIAQTNGSLSGELLEDAVLALYANPSARQIQELPKLLEGLSNLGVPASTISDLRRALADAITSSDVDPQIQDAAIATLESGPAPIKLAQNRRPRNPPTTNQLPRDPVTTGQSAGGGYR